MLSAVIALVGALVYGSADFFGGLAARRLRSIVVSGVAAGSGLVALLLALPLIGGVWSVPDVLWGVVAGAFGVVAIVLLYACLAIGPMSILSPLTAVVSAIAPMLWGLLVNGDTLSAVGFAGLGVALVAVVLVGFIPGRAAVRPSVRGLVMAVGAGLAIGAFLIVVDRTSDESGLVPLVLSRSTTVVVTLAVVGVMLVVARRRGWSTGSVLYATPRTPAPSSSSHDLGDLQDLGAIRGLGSEISRKSGMTSAPHGDPSALRSRAWWLAIAGGVLDAAANTLMLIALRLGELSIVSALTALYPAGTILLAAIVLRERVAPVQVAGLVLALVAGGLLALA